LQVEQRALQVEQRSLQVEQRSLQVEQRALQVEQRSLQVEQRALQVEQEALQVEQRSLQVEQRSLQVEQRALQVEQRALQVEQRALQVEQRALQVEQRALLLSDDNLEGRAQQIHGNMEGSAFFPTPDPTLAAFLTAITAFSVAVAAAKDGGHLAVTIKNEKREELLNMLLLLSSYVLFTAKENKVIVVSSGFAVRKQAEPTPPLTKPENLQVMPGINIGEFQMKVANVKGAICYLHQVSSDATLAEESWRTVSSTTSQALIVNLQPGIKYYCRVGAIGSKKQLVYSDVVSRVAA
jgi:cell division protein FtsL